MLYQYKGFHNCDSVCDVRVYGNIVIATEGNSNHGTSITNMAEVIATDIAKMHAIKLEDLVWFECYEGRLEECSKVVFEIENGKYVNPTWRNINKEYIAKTIEGLTEITNIK